MPGFVLHMTAAKILTDSLPDNHKLNMDLDTHNTFCLGNLLPDMSMNKQSSYFQNPAHQNDVLQVPDLNIFLNKYLSRMSNPFYLGYFFHLYMDYTFLWDYLKNEIIYLDRSDQPTFKNDQVYCAYIRSKKVKLPMSTFLSDEYYYGDYTRISSYLIKKYQLSFDFDLSIETPHMDELPFENLPEFIEKIKAYANSTDYSIDSLKVFDAKRLIHFIDKQTKAFLNLYSFLFY